MLNGAKHTRPRGSCPQVRPLWDCTHSKKHTRITSQSITQVTHPQSDPPQSSRPAPHACANCQDCQRGSPASRHLAAARVITRCTSSRTPPPPSSRSVALNRVRSRETITLFPTPPSVRSRIPGCRTTAKTCVPACGGRAFPWGRRRRRSRQGQGRQWNGRALSGGE